MEKFWLTSLTIKKCKLIKTPITLSFSKNENILLGLNGSGKTTLLEIIKGCLDSFCDFFIENEYDFHIEYTLELKDISVIIDFQLDFKERKYLENELLNRIGNKEENDIVYQIEVDIKTGTAHYQANWTKDSFMISGDTDLQEEGISGEPWNALTNGLKKMTELSDKTLSKIARSLWGFFVYNLCSLRRFTESTEIFDIWQDSSYFRLQNLDEKLIYDNSWIFFIKNFVDILQNNLPIKSRFSDSYLITAEEYPFLNKIAERLNYKAIRIEFFFDNKIKETNKVLYTWKKFRIFIDINKNTTLTFDRLSHGEKRFILLMLYLHSNVNAVVVDEILNGLHHSMILALLNEMEDKQSFLAVQNPMMLDYIEFDSINDVKEKLIFCSCEVEGMNWRNPNKEEVHMLFSEIEKDFQHISEILRQKQLW